MISNLAIVLCAYIYVTLIMLATVFSMAWCKLAMQRSHSIPWNIPLVTCIFCKLTCLKAREYTEKIQDLIDIICSKKQTVFPEESLRKTASFKEQIMSKEYTHAYFCAKWEAIAFIILQIFFATRSFENWGILF